MCYKYEVCRCFCQTLLPVGRTRRMGTINSVVERPAHCFQPHVCKQCNIIVDTTNARICPENTRSLLAQVGKQNCSARIKSCGCKTESIFGRDRFVRLSASLIFYFLFNYFRTLLLSSFWTSRGHRCRPFFPPVLAFNF